MKKSFWLVVLLALALVLSLSACQRSASKAPTSTAANVPFPTPLPGNALKNVMSGTQTAQAALTKPAGTPIVTIATKAGAAAPTASKAAPAVPAATAKPVVAATQAPTALTPFITIKPAEYTLQKGEFPFCIARRFDVNVRDLLSLNGLSMSSQPSIGTTLKIPSSGSWVDGSRSLISHPATYTVNSGDTIFTIACTYGDVDPNAIIAANNLKSPYTLSAGQTLSIP